MGEKTVVVSLTCSKRRDTMVKVCEVFESLNIKIISANITAFSGRLLKTAFIEVNSPSFVSSVFVSFFLPLLFPLRGVCVYWGGIYFLFLLIFSILVD